MKIHNIKVEELIRLLSVMKKNNVDLIDVEIADGKLKITPSDVPSGKLTEKEIINLIL